MSYQNRPPPSVCPNCGEDVPPKALACPECGADYETGWKTGAESYGHLPEDDFDYDESFKKEFGREVIPTHVKPIWWITGIILLALVVVGIIKALM